MIQWAKYFISKKKKYYGHVYLIVNMVSYKVYVGAATVRPNIRWRAHQRTIVHNHIYDHRIKNPMHVDMVKYGLENFCYIVVAYAANSRKLCNLEKRWIKDTQAIDPDKGYNKKSGDYEITPLLRIQRSRANIDYRIRINDKRRKH